MEDDEEFSYSGYSENTVAALRIGGTAVTVTGDEEEHSYIGTAAHAEGHTVPVRSKIGYGDFIVEEISAQSHAHKISELTHISERKIKFFLSPVYLVLGAVCIIFAAHIGVYFPYIVGGIAALFGTAQLIFAICTREYVHTHSNKTASSLVMMALGVLIMAEHSAAYAIIAVAWGFLGLMSAAHAFNHGFSRMARSMRWGYYICRGIVEAALAFMLLYAPNDAEHIYFHIIVFGIQLIVSAFNTFPPVKEYLSRAK